MTAGPPASSGTDSEGLYGGIGIGFTMSLFIGTLAFDDEAVLKQVRLGALMASLLSGIVAALMFSVIGKSNEARSSR